MRRRCTDAGCRIITSCVKRARQQQQHSLPGNSSSSNRQQRRYDHSSSSSSSSSSASPTKTSSNNNYNPLTWYALKLDTHPIITKMITSGIIAASGDILCQYLTTTTTTSMTHHSSTEEEESSFTTIENENLVTYYYDWKRTIRFFILGSCLVAPTVHAWYNILLKYIPGTNGTSILKRLIADQGFFGPIFTGTFISCLTILEHVIPNNTDNVVDDDSSSSMMMTVGGGEETTTTTATIIMDVETTNTNYSLYMNITTRIYNDLPNAIIVGWGMWIPSMAFMFTFVPVKYQVLFSNGVGLVWNTYLSWRTNQDDN